MEPTTLREVQNMTNNFSYQRLIGQGETGKVYKGLLPSGQIMAMKLLHIGVPGLNDVGFYNKFFNISRIRHRNLLGHISYIYGTRRIRKSYDINEKTFRVLCFDYMPTGSLDRYLDDESSGLDWQTRFQIIKGICEGLKYLHVGLKEPIYHLGLKPSNILLDHDMVPKLADFGLIKMIHEYLNERRRDKLAYYWPPECVHGRVASTAFDVFSLGAVMIEIVTGLRDTKSTTMSPKNLIGQAEKKWRKRLQETFSGSELEDYCLQVKRCTEIALRCMEKDPHMRPNMMEVVQMLNPIDNMGIDPRKKAMQNPQDLFAEYIGNISSCDDKYEDLIVLERMVNGSGKLKPVQFQFLKLITNGFSEKLRIGSGGCGEVYMGILRNGLVAVKRLFNSHTIEDKMFHQEVKSMTMVKHPNIVRFLGYCSQTGESVIEMPPEKVKRLSESIIMGQIRERLLCFEYISNGSLENHLTDELRGLEWHKRYQIIKGICEGLQHLHKEKHIIHMDLKPANVLLDDNMVPKITDFGLSRIDEKSKTMSAERLLSLGYCPQEYMHDGKFSSKSDIYSLGVIIIELVAGTKELVTGSIENRNTAKVLRRWRHRWMKSAKDYSLVSIWFKQVTKCLDIAAQCIDTEPLKRPHIWEILSELNKINSADDFISDGTEPSYLMRDLKDMLGIEPLEIHLPFELNKQITCSVKLDNDTDNYFAFSISTHSLRTYNIHPSIGIVPPRSKCNVSIALQLLRKAPLEERCKEDFIVQSTIVDGSLQDKDITGDIFDEAPGRVVDRVNLIVVLDVRNHLLCPI